MRKVSAVVCSLLLMATALAVFVLPAGAQSYPPPTNPPTTTTTGGPVVTTTTTLGPSVVTTTTTQAKATASTLAFTGSDSTPLVIFGLIAVTLGAILVVAARRRSSVKAPKAG